MATASATVSRWARGFVVASACWLVIWQLAVLAGSPRRSSVTLGLFGFVLHMLFGKAYSLVPSYFDRTLAVAHAPAIHLPLAVGGTAALAVSPLATQVSGIPASIGAVGALLWAGGSVVFLGTLGWTIRDNLTGRETGTGEHNAERKLVDRMANAVMPIALTYLAVGTYGLLAVQTPLPTVFDGYTPRPSHLLAAGTAALLVFAIGFRLLPRFLVVSPPEWLVGLVLSTGVLGPLLLAVGLPTGALLRVGAVVQTVAVTGFAVGYLWLFARSERRRVGFYGVLGGSIAGVGVVTLGLSFAMVSGVRTPALVAAHYRLAILGFLGLTIVGVSFQFYPPSVTDFPVDGDRLGAGVLLALAGGLLIEVGGSLAGRPTATVVGQTVVLAGAIAYASLLIGLFAQRARQ